MIQSKKYYVWIVTTICFISFVMYLSIYVYHHEKRDNLLHIYFFSLEKGRSVFLRTPDHSYILIGGGQNTQVIRELTKVIPFYRRKIDTIVVPSEHPHQIGGLLDIIHRYSVDTVIIPYPHATSTVLSLLMKEVYAQKIHVVEVTRGDEIQISKDISLEIIFPYEDFNFNKTSTPELGALLHYQSTSLYLLGNLSRTIQKDIFKYISPQISDSIVEFFHTGSPAKVFKQLIDSLHPYFIFTTREKTTHLISNGREWRR